MTLNQLGKTGQIILETCVQNHLEASAGFQVFRISQVSGILNFICDCLLTLSWKLSRLLSSLHFVSLTSYFPLFISTAVHNHFLQILQWSHFLFLSFYFAFLVFTLLVQLFLKAQVRKPSRPLSKVLCKKQEWFRRFSIICLPLLFLYLFLIMFASCTLQCSHTQLPVFSICSSFYLELPPFFSLQI